MSRAARKELREEIARVCDARDRAQRDLHEVIELDEMPAEFMGRA
jgi:hypothetical protein